MNSDKILYVYVSYISMHTVDVCLGNIVNC